MCEVLAGNQIPLIFLVEANDQKPNFASCYRYVTGFQGRRNRENETGELKQGQTVWAICSQFVTNKPLSSATKDTEHIVQTNKQTKNSP